MERRSSVLVLLIKLIQILLVLRLVGPHAGGVTVQRALVVGLAEKRLDRQEDRADVIQRRPFLLQDVEAQSAVQIDVGMETFGQEVNRRWRVRIGVRELEQQAVTLSIVDGVLRTLKEAQKFRQRTAENGRVPSSPVMVPIHRKKFSFSGNAETLFSVLIMSAMSSFCNLIQQLRVENSFSLAAIQVFTFLKRFPSTHSPRLDCSWCCLSGFRD